MLRRRLTEVGFHLVDSLLLDRNDARSLFLSFPHHPCLMRCCLCHNRTEMNLLEATHKFATRTKKLEWQRNENTFRQFNVTKSMIQYLIKTFTDSSSSATDNCV